MLTLEKEVVATVIAKVASWNIFFLKVQGPNPNIGL
jgi:hypothetical protein